METIVITEAQRLALARAGLLKPEWTGLPKRATGLKLRARKAAHRIIRRFGYLLKADWTAEKLKVLSVLFEEGNVIGKANTIDREAVRTALDRYAEALKLKLAGRRIC